jgi:CheY-like chemotaxis protein
MAQHRILIVDDEPKVTFFFQQHLEMIGEGYTVTAVNSGKDALAQLKKQQYDLMITDLRMPEMDGLELIRHTRKASPNTRIMLVTAYGTSDVFAEA